MNYRGAIIVAISRLIERFGPHCADRETLDWLHRATADRGKWERAHGVFNHIRTKTLNAERRGNLSAAAQYLFEEICAKTMYNLSGAAAPFDSDSPYWVLPNAIALARQIGVPDAAVLACVRSRSRVPMVPNNRVEFARVARPTRKSAALLLAAQRGRWRARCASAPAQSH